MNEHQRGFSTVSPGGYESHQPSRTSPSFKVIFEHNKMFSSMQRIEKIDSYSVPLHFSKQSRNAILNRNQGHCTKQFNEGIVTRARRPSGIKPTHHRELFILHSLTDGTHTRP